MEYIGITLDGNKDHIKKYAYSFNMAAFLEIEKWTGLKVSELFTEEGMEASTYMKLLYLGLKYGQDEIGKKLDFTYSAFVDITTGNDEILNKLGEFFKSDWEVLMAIFEEKSKLTEGDKVDENTKKKKVSGRTTSV